MRNTYLYGFATFGHPNDYRQSAFVFDKKEIAKNVKIFDLTNAIKVFPNSILYSIRKENIGGAKGISYSIYSFANEMSSMRDGTFIGSSILFTNEIAEENLTVGKLNEFHKLLVEKNTINDVLNVKHSNDFELPKQFFNDFEKVSFLLKPIEDLENFSTSNKQLVVGSRTDQSNLTINFKKALLLLNKYDTIFFTYSNEIITYCQNRNIYSITDEKGFDQEIADFQNEKQQKLLKSISEFEREVQRIDEDKKRAIQEFKTQLDQFKNLHQANAKKISEAEGDISKINQFYEQFIRETNKLIGNLKNNNTKLEEVKNIHNDNKRSFNINLPNLKSPNYITSIEKPKPKGNLHIEHQHQDLEHKSGHRRREEIEQQKEKTYKIDIFKVATLILTFLLIVTWVYFLFFKSNSVDETVVIQNQEQVDTFQQEQEQEQEPDEIAKIEDLKPKSNSTLNENDYKIVAKNLKRNMKLDEVVKVIFTKNPTEIGSNYAGQEDIYSKHLLELNKKSFEEKEGVYLFTNDTIKQIPSYKRNNE